MTIAVANKVYLTRRTGVKFCPLVDVELPSISGFVGVFYHRNNVNIQPGFYEGHGCCFSLKLEIFNSIIRVELYQSVEDFFAETREGFLGNILTGNIKNHIYIDRIFICFTQNCKFCRTESYPVFPILRNCIAESGNRKWCKSNFRKGRYGNRFRERI